ncbi:competence type IV pilus ATPase ComGA [Streptococcus halichoeri]|uniref:competence type IV pilus ATPase ComGA n=1 Tax=Streptococcus halichoeri TaxID=254785 RepID=UPI00135B5934|nr:competence type IV pilus ATPase ComGA [Streptococcus halichoeri]
MVKGFTQQLLQEAIAAGAEDLYLLPYKKTYQIYIKTLAGRKHLSAQASELMLQVISHLKFLSGMNVGEKRRSQLGACTYHLPDHQKIRLRLSTVGDYQGRESLVIRLLQDGSRELAYWGDGWSQVLTKIKGRGLYLFAGPVGSGKTTLMHALAREKFAKQQMIAIEDPVEIQNDSMLQLQVNTTIGMTYDELIKLSLRHRPDLLIIGEIRDPTTAAAAVRASLTGAVVFSTIHAKSIPGVFARLLELGVSRKELAHTLSAITYQRLLGGKGVIDSCASDYENYSGNAWNQQIQALYEEGLISKDQYQTETLDC